jgi:hypothetical protein
MSILVELNAMYETALCDYVISLLFLTLLSGSKRKYRIIAGIRSTVQYIEHEREPSRKHPALCDLLPAFPPHVG